MLTKAFMKAFTRHIKSCKRVNNLDELLWILGLDIPRKGRDGPLLTDTARKVPKALMKVVKAFTKLPKTFLAGYLTRYTEHL
jgi:hypothetical protein